MNLSVDTGALLRRFGLLLAFGVLVAVLSLISDQFLTVGNIVNLLVQASVIATIAVGMTMVILTAGIDLSVGSVLALSAVVTADLLKTELPVFVAVLGGLSVGGLSGLVSGLLVTVVNIPPFIATLGMMSLVRGLALTYAGGMPITSLPSGFQFLGTGTILAIPVPIIIMAVAYAVGILLLTRSKLGQYIYAIGNNAVAARVSGLPVKTIKILVYVISGALAALAGFILVARLDSAQPTMGIRYELDTIAAVVVGGTVLSGGHGTLWGTILGALIMAVIANAINILGISPFYAQVVQGAVIIGALLIHQFAGRIGGRS
jgi:ribose transport system permease protein